MIRESWNLNKLSFRLIWKDKEIMLLAFIEGVLITLSLLFIFIPIILSLNWIFHKIIFPITALFIIYLVHSIFSFSIIFVAYSRLNGENPNIFQSFYASSKKINFALKWAAVSIIVHILSFNYIKKKINLPVDAGKILWNHLTFFVLPIALIENKGVKDSLVESVKMFRKTFGETILGEVTMGLLFIILGLLWFIPFICLLFIDFQQISVDPSLHLTAYFMLGGLIYLIFLLILSSAVSRVFTASVYFYAKTGKIPEGLSPKEWDNVLKTRFTDKNKI